MHTISLCVVIRTQDHFIAIHLNRAVNVHDAVVEARHHNEHAVAPTQYDMHENREVQWSELFRKR